MSREIKEVEIEGRKFTNISSLTNHIRWRVKVGKDESYDSCIRKYILTEAPKCSMVGCEIDVEYSGVEWNKYCSDERCKENRKKYFVAQTSKSRIGYIDQPFLEHFKENYQLYLDLYDNTKDLVIFPYTGKEIEKHYIPLYISKFIPRVVFSEITSIEVKCAWCENKFYVNGFDVKVGNKRGMRKTCCRVCATSYSNNGGKSKRDKILLKELSDANKTRMEMERCIQGTYNGDSVMIYPYEENYTKYCEKQYKASNESLELFLAKSLNAFCFECGKPIDIKKFLIGRDKNETQFCDMKCYHEARRTGRFIQYENTVERRLAASIKMKEKIANGEFTPCVTNSWSHSRVVICGMKFRSTWEAGFWLVNPHLKFEEVRVPYINPEGVQRNYIIDFHDASNKKLYEIKPDSEINDETNILKFEAAKTYCKKNGYEYIIVGNSWFIENRSIIFQKLDEIDQDEMTIKVRRNISLIK